MNAFFEKNIVKVLIVLFYFILLFGLFAALLPFFRPSLADVGLGNSLANLIIVLDFALIVPIVGVMFAVLGRGWMADHKISMESGVIGGFPLFTVIMFPISVIVITIVGFPLRIEN